jgi:hypothetical protein
LSFFFKNSSEKGKRGAPTGTPMGAPPGAKAGLIVPFRSRRLEILRILLGSFLLKERLWYLAVIHYPFYPSRLLAQPCWRLPFIIFPSLWSVCMIRDIATVIGISQNLRDNLNGRNNDQSWILDFKST